jgi:hypothetical protein
MKQLEPEGWPELDDSVVYDPWSAVPEKEVAFLTLQDQIPDAFDLS